MAADPGGLNRIRRLPSDVVDKIAAGEVVQRPYNVVKELIENCIDADATHITVTIGGVKTIQVEDDGHGIAKADLPMLCVRHATSKLRDVDGLNAIQSYGFRGEALASMSQVAHVTAVSRAKDAPLAYSMTYDGITTTPRAVAGNMGTVIRLADLFYNMPTRRKAMRNSTEEFNLIRTLIINYSLMTPAISFTLKKAGEASVDTKTGVEATFARNFAAHHTRQAADALVDVVVDAREGVVVERCSFVSSAGGDKSRKYTLVTFVNRRLVQWPALKRPLGLICQPFFPPPSQPHIFVALRVPPHHVDVNVHPSKETVTLLHEDVIVDDLLRAFDSALQRANDDRTFASQTITSNSLKTTPMASPSSGTRQVYDHQLVRTDANQSKLYESWHSPVAQRGTPTAKESKKENIPVVTIEESPKHGGNRDEITASVSEIMNGSQFVDTELDSVLNLRRKMCAGASSSLRRLVRNSVLVGIVDRTLLLVQFETRMYRVLLAPFIAELVRQGALFLFGRMPSIVLGTPLPMSELVAMIDGDDVDVAVLDAPAGMLEDYFGIGVHDRMLTRLPLPVEALTPCAAGIAHFVHELCTVDYTAEETCFSLVLDAIGRLYATCFVDVPEAEMATTVRASLYPTIKQRLLPNAEWMDNGVVRPVLDLHDLYKVFERC